ncbi:GAF domain-containing protein [Nodularia spumigena CS-584]|jgi:methyl-accepting chemotaxis protein PixJ|uniref:GAF domain-containing protein n=1 Tax=Nodularia spumigena UHCC 0060 TaxID=3110300 RepID=A0ABU5UT38_NODSP|nr:GAF domain-containing protein [Nodularia spumigena]AHJ29510.1 Circadian input kinase A [Nodularia spumigena CCY9414]EAW45733.1 methyl-accepting chemotaxis protein [Nodularia spumigena CCY9414]MDB9382178.1 GAF domain-containing protein [Nodularia spumigena CS-584]MEA5525489.1 GAF domain-containing protein [Nodularia spumigena UHCC 0143]MEA5556798.1 GAF domain-containing protein [Nodularia spumigena CH309]
MTVAYDNNQENEQNMNDLQELENHNGGTHIANIMSDSISELNAVSQEFKNWRRQLQEITTRMRQASDMDTLFQVTVAQLRAKIACDRALIYRFTSLESGTVLSESRTRGWTPTLSENLPGILFGLYTSEDYLEPVAINDINQVQLTPYQKQLLEKFQVQSLLSVPIVVGGKVWGLLAINNCALARQWQESETTLLSQISTELIYRLQSFEFQKEIQQQTLAKKSVAKVIDKILRVSNLEQIFNTTTQEIRQLLRCDRVGVYRFQPDWSGQFIAESVGEGWIKMVTPDFKMVWEDSHLQETKGGRYAKGESFAVNDIYEMDHAQCHIDILEQFQMKAYMIVPIFAGEQLWGLLAAYQNSGPREWQSWQVSFLTQIGLQFGVAISQGEYLEQVQFKSDQLVQIAAQEKALTKIVNRIRQSLDVDEIFKTATQEVRQLLRCDRVAVYRFSPDWGGEFVAESVGHNWVKLVGIDIKTVWDDSHLQETQGGRYAKGESFVAKDIYKVDHSPCHIEILEQFEIKAYVIVPIFSGEQLWGLFAAYQNSGPRDWEETEATLLARMGDQLGLALQQTEYLQQLQTQSAQLAEAAAREKAAKELLQQRSIQLLTAVRPALDGDLTVRAPVTEDELGTIADAYNNTLQALRQIVIQVQTTSQKVAQTSSNSDASLAGLTNLAKQQSEEITTALDDIQHMVDSTKAVVTNADLVQVALQKANQTVESGDAAMNQTVKAIQGIRETVAQTSKKIKRLSESSQKISKVVNLISNFATQTNVLALNAAIEATRAGEYGKGFAVVADEVRSLSRQSAAATIEIEKLVQEIQAETGEVSVAMETGIQQVVEGTNFVGETRQNLNAIVSATAEISLLIQRITAATQEQMGQSVTVTASMQDVAEIANKTFTESQEIATVLQDLSGMAQGLLATASKFKVN